MLTGGFPVWRVLTVAAVLVLAGMTGLGMTHRVAAAHGGPASGGDGTAASAASVARSSGRRVEVTALRSVTGEVFANPDGTFTAEEHVRPVRVRRPGGWVPVDTRLRARPDGAVVPGATVVPVVFSGGGRTPLVRLGEGAERVALGWPRPLPVPVLEGDTAVYREVLPGVDMRLRARPEGYSQVLVVKTRAAARSPMLATLRFSLSSRLRLRTDGRGVLRAAGPSGRTVFQAATPRMWDTGKDGSTGSAGSTASATGVVSASAHRAAVGIRVAGGGLTLTPDRAMLTDRATRFPVYVDPDFFAGLRGWAEVLAQHPNDAHWGGDGDPVAKVGFSDWDVPTVTYRSYFQYDTAGLLGKDVISAEFNARENWAPSCSPRPVELWETGPINPGTTWNAQPGGSWLGTQNVAHGHDASCGPDFVGFDATRAVVDAVNGGSPTTTVMLRATNEGDRFAWKKFDTNPALIVHYNSFPAVPTGLSAATGLGCANEPNEPYLDLRSPAGLHATVSDPDGGPVMAEFEWRNRFGDRVGGQTTVPQPSGTTFTADLPVGTFPDGGKIAWRVRGLDGRDAGPWSQLCDLTVDSTPPDRAPEVSSGTYPENVVGGAIGKTGAFTLSAQGVPDVSGYFYGTQAPSTFVAAGGLGGSATIQVTPPDDKPHSLFVRSVDRAGNVSPQRTYIFQAGPAQPPVARWRLDGYAPTTTAPDLPGRTHGGTLTGAASWTMGRVDDAVHFNGTTSAVSTGGGAAVRTDGSFSVAAWVRLDTADGQWRTAVSEDGARASGFYLQYVGDAHRWAFAMPPADADDFVPDRAVAAAPPVVGAWTHLVGVYDVASGQLRLYVNGVLAATASHTTPWNATGGVQIGRAKFGGAPVDFWAGSVDDVQVYDRVLTDLEIDALVDRPAVEEAAWSFDESSGPVAADASGNLHAAAATGGASWVPGHVGAGAVRLDGSGSLSTTGPVLRTDNSFTVTAQVLLGAADNVTRTAVSQDGTRTGAFALQYRGDTHKWAFTVDGADADGAPQVQAVDKDTAQAGEWTQLTGVYDAATRQVKLYVNSAPVSAAPGELSWNATGAFQLGRAKRNGVAAESWLGSLDDVHVYTGVLTDDQIRELSFAPKATREYAHGGLSRYVDHDSDHVTSNGPVPLGFHYEGPLGWFAPEGAPGTRMLYSCLDGTEEFTSMLETCEGRRLLGPLGLVYTTQPAGTPTLPLYRCHGDNGDHFDSLRSDCEGAANSQVEGLLGYTAMYTTLVRYNRPDQPSDHWTSTQKISAGYLPEGSLGIVAMVQMPGTTLLFACNGGDDEFTSGDPGCGGAQVIGPVGYVWSEPPEGVRSTRLFACTVRTTGEHFDSVDSFCEGQTVGPSLGYIITGF